jgi:hypothetical protein
MLQEKIVRETKVPSDLEALQLHFPAAGRMRGAHRLRLNAVGGTPAFHLPSLVRRQGA